MLILKFPAAVTDSFYRQLYSARNFRDERQMRLQLVHFNNLAH